MMKVIFNITFDTPKSAPFSLEPRARRFSMSTLRKLGAVGAVVATAGCGSSAPSAPLTDAQYEQNITQGMHDALQANLNTLVQATTALQAAAPDAPWDDTNAAYPTMVTEWIAARHAYEQIEGATAPVFPDIDLSIDGRVEDFGPPPGGSGALTITSDMFGNMGMTGLHAIERIMYVNTTPASVVAYETGLGYVPPQAFPTTQQQADEFKNELCTQAVTDATRLLNDWHPATPDIGSAFDGLVSLMNEQKEKVTKAGLDQEESRYSQHTMDDLQAESPRDDGDLRHLPALDRLQVRWPGHRRSGPGWIPAAQYALQQRALCRRGASHAACRLERRHAVGRRSGDPVRPALLGRPVGGQPGDDRIRGL